MKADRRLNNAYKNADIVYFDDNTKYIFLVISIGVMTAFQMNSLEIRIFFCMH